MAIEGYSAFSSICLGSSNPKKAVKEASLDFFAAHHAYTPAQKEIIRKRITPIIEQTRKNANLKRLPKNDAESRAFFKELNEVAIFAGSPLKLPACVKASPEIQAIYKKLLLGELGLSEIKTFLKPSLVSAILFRQNPQLFKEAKELFGKVLKKIAPQLPNLSEKELFSAKSIIGNILSYYTYFGLENGEILSIPQQVDGTWKLVKYSVEKIYLTPSAMGSPITAFGLTPIDEKAPPLLLFKGTTIPTDQGAALSVLTDINPFGSVGSYAFKLGKANLKTWLEKNHLKTGLKANVYGQSLGGALTLHAAVNFPSLVAECHAYAPPALLPHEIRSWNRLYGKNPEAMPRVRIFYQENDIVPLTGLKWGEGWEIFRVFPSKSKNFFFSHMQCFLSQNESLILKADAKMDEKKFSRYFLAITHLVLSLPFFTVGVTVYAVYLTLRKVVEFSVSLFKRLQPRTV